MTEIGCRQNCSGNCGSTAVTRRGQVRSLANGRYLEAKCDAKIDLARLDGRAQVPRKRVPTTGSLCDLKLQWISS